MRIQRQQTQRIQARRGGRQRERGGDGTATGTPGGPGTDQAKRRCVGLHRASSLYLFDSGRVGVAVSGVEVPDDGDIDHLAPALDARLPGLARQNQRSTPGNPGTALNVLLRSIG